MRITIAQSLYAGSGGILFLLCVIMRHSNYESNPTFLRRSPPPRSVLVRGWHRTSQVSVWYTVIPFSPPRTPRFLSFSGRAIRAPLACRFHLAGTISWPLVKFPSLAV